MQIDFNHFQHHFKLLILMKIDQLGFIDPEQLEFYDLVAANLDVFINELMNDSLDLYLAKNRVGFQKTWLNMVTENDDLSLPVEKWIREGGFHQDQIGYDSRNGQWQTFPLWKANDPTLGDAIKQFLPQTLNILSQIPQLHFAAFFKQPPQAAIRPHCHKIEHHILHFLLNDLEDGYAWIQVNDHKRKLQKKGDCIGFDYTYTHCSCNESSSDRINLVLDVKL